MGREGEKAEEKVHKDTEIPSLWGDSLVPLPVAYLMSLWRIRVRLSPQCMAKGDFFSAQ